MHGARVHRVVRTEGVAAFTGVRLPDGERWQWASVSGAGASMRYRYGNQASPTLELLAGPGLSAVHVHPGPDVFAEFAGGLGNEVWIFVSGAAEEE